MPIALQKVSKQYRLYPSPAYRVRELLHPLRKKYHTTFYALRDLSLSVGQGETVGIIGRNGSGKSTLLQIICGIMPPTSGRLKVCGRISAILELGAGFNPEFTGRENIYLNCSILGMNRDEVDARLDGILAFADIGTFIDQPVKTYSSGMAIRLAFSIAISVDPQILVVDEALAVGDAAFQRKCFSRIRSIQEQGASILFVSHDASAVTELCDRVILLDRGEKIFAGDPKDAVAFYHKLLYAPADGVESVRTLIVEQGNRKGDGQPAGHSSLRKITALREGKEANPGGREGGAVSADRNVSASFNEEMVPQSTLWYKENGAGIRDPHVETKSGRCVNVLVRGCEYEFVYSVDFRKTVKNVRYCMLIKTVRGIELGGYCGPPFSGAEDAEVAAGSRAAVRLRFRCALRPGFFFFNAGVMGDVEGEDGYLHRGIDVVMIEVVESEPSGATAVIDFDIKPSVSLQSCNTWE